MYRIVFIALATLLCTGCSNYVRHPSGDGRYLPRENAYTIQPDDFSESRSIDFDAVYVAAFTLPASSKWAGEVTYNYYRFWPTGHVIYDYSSSLPDAAMADDFSHGFTGFYQILGDGSLEMEFFRPDFASRKWSSQFETVVIEPDGLTRHSSDVELSYYRRPLSGMERQPDW